MAFRVKSEHIRFCRVWVVVSSAGSPTTRLLVRTDVFLTAQEVVRGALLLVGDLAQVKCLQRVNRHTQTLGVSSR